jgi:hypothetical protein
MCAIFWLQAPLLCINFKGKQVAWNLPRDKARQSSKSPHYPKYENRESTDEKENSIKSQISEIRLTWMLNGQV